MAEAKKRTGRCGCGGVTFEINGAFRDTVACYCKQCQRGTGNFVVANQFNVNDLEFISDDTLKWYISSDFAKRGFCSACGSPIFFRVNDSEYMSVKTGVMDDTSDLPIVYNIFVDDIGGHCVINEQLPSNSGYPKDDPNYPFIDE